jgi:hypothetical protein
MSQYSSNQDRFNEVTAEYEGWLKKNGVWISDKVEITDLRSEGRGRGIGESDLAQFCPSTLLHSRL